MLLFNTNDSKGLLGETLRVCGTLLALCLAYSLAQGVKIRFDFWKMRRQGVPMIPYSLFLGHLPILRQLTAGLPRDIHPNYIPQLVFENWRTLFPGRNSCPPVIYLDPWPIGPPVIFIVDPETGIQTISDMNVKRSRNTLDFLRPLSDGLDLVSMEGEAWKLWRTRFNPAFSTKNITTLIPGLVHDAKVFADIIRHHAGPKAKEWGDVFSLQELTTNLTIDVIGRAALGMELREQTEGPGKLKVGLMSQISLMMFRLNIIDVIRWHSPWRKWSISRNTRMMDEALNPAVTECMRKRDDGAHKTIIGQAIKLVKDSPQQDLDSLDPLFVKTVMGHLKSFMFGGHDTTASTLCWVLHIVAKGPGIAQRLRTEHDEVFGRDTADLEAKLGAMPHLLNSLPYTAGVIKEALRLYPAVASLREGSPQHFFLDKETGVRCPTDGCFVIDGVRSLSRAEEIWPRAHEVLPERWCTTDANDPLRAQRNASRMFGSGPRVCIGQELAMTEMKLAVVFLARELELDCAWDEWDAARNMKPPKVLVEGHRCYQTDHGTPHINEGMPVRVRLR